MQTPLFTGPETSGFEVRMSNFLDSVRTGTPPVSNLDRSVSLTKMLVATYEFSSAGNEIRLVG